MTYQFHAASLSLTTLFSLVALASIILFIVYAVEWHNHIGDTPDTNTVTGESDRQYRERVRTEYAYYASVISLLFVLMSMHTTSFSRLL